jgi:glycosyltransferase involved in cell wall biosynthesis
MTLTEAGACATPAVATRIAGHEDAVRDGESGILVDDREDLAQAIEKLCTDSALRSRMGDAAQKRASELQWSATAVGTLEVLAAEAVRRQHT